MQLSVQVSNVMMEILVVEMDVIHSAILNIIGTVIDQLVQMLHVVNFKTLTKSFPGFSLAH